SPVPSIKKPNGSVPIMNHAKDPRFQLVEKKDMAWKGSPESLKIKNWQDMGLDRDVLDSIRKGLQFARPSQVQAAYISSVLNGDSGSNYICGSQTGSGKTVAFLAPIMHRLKQQEKQAMEDDRLAKSSDSYIVEAMDSAGKTFSSFGNGLGTIRKAKRPRAIVLVPSRQLIDQITQVAKTMAHYSKLRVVGIHSKSKHTRESLESPIDVLVTTPSALLGLMAKDGLALSQLTMLVLDEADSLFDRNFIDETKKIIRLVLDMSAARSRPIAISLFTATLPQTLNAAVDDIPNLVRLTTPTLHHTPTTVHQDF
ncbi:putative ATP-dependent RNA helicase ddx28, partial [Kappamyces sp. JEL0680]